MPDFYRSSTIIVPDGVVLSTPLNHQKPPTQHCHSQWCSWHVGYDQMLTLSSSAIMFHDAVFKMGRHILIRVFPNDISTGPWMLLNQTDEFLFQSTTPPWDKSVLDGLNQTLGQPRNTQHNTPTAYEISLPVTLYTYFDYSHTRQHPMFRNALILLIIDLRLSGSRTAWLYDSRTTS